MQSVTFPRPRVKPSRTARVSAGTPQGVRVLTLTVGNAATLYFLRKLPSDFGTAFELEKFDGTGTYAVNLDTDVAGHATCECLGHLRWGYRTTCRHVAALRSLIKSGKLS
jgi:hypothetical protein